MIQTKNIIIKLDDDGSILEPQPMKYDISLSVDSNAGSRYFLKFIDSDSSSTQFIEANTKFKLDVYADKVVIRTDYSYYELCPENVNSINSLGVSDMSGIVAVFDSIFI